MNNFAFIDAQNVHLGIKSLGWNLDWKKFRVYLADKFHVSKAFLFIGRIKGNERLYGRLKSFGYELVFKPVLESKQPKVKTKGNVDADLVLHTMIEFPNYQKAIIVSGDGDFYCLVEYLEKKKKLGKIIVPNRKYSSLLRKFRSFIVHVDDFKSKVKKNERD